MGEYVPRLVPGLRLRDDLKPLEITQPEGASFTLDGNVLRWQKWSLRVGFNHREGMVLHTVGYEDGGRVAPRRAPAVVRRDGRALPRPDARPLPAHRVRHRRVGPRLHDHVAGARLRLPGRDRLPRRGRCTTRAASRTRSPTRSASTRRTTRVLWKHVDAETGAEVRRAAPARRLLPRHRRQLRVPRLLALLPGRQHRVRGARHRDHGHDPLRRGRAAALRHARRRAHLRAVPPALPRRAPRPRRRRGGQHGRRHGVRGAADRPRQPARAGARAARHAAAHGAEGRQDYDWHTQRAWKVVNASTRATGSARRSPTSSCPAARFPPMLDPGLARAAARAEAIGHTLWVTPFRRGRALAVRRVRRPERARTSGCRPGPRRTARSRTPTSCSGTSSASTTSRARRSGR